MYKRRLVIIRRLIQHFSPCYISVFIIVGIAFMCFKYCILHGSCILSYINNVLSTKLNFYQNTLPSDGIFVTKLHRLSCGAGNCELQGTGVVIRFVLW